MLSTVRSDCSNIALKLASSSRFEQGALLWIPLVDTPCKPLFTVILCKFHHGIVHVVEAYPNVLQGLDFEAKEIENNLRNFEREATEQFIDDADLSPEERERRLREEYQRDQEMRAELIRSKKGGKSEE